MLIGGAYTVGQTVTVPASTGTLTIGGSTNANATFSGAITLTGNVTIAQAANTGTNSLSITGNISGGGSIVVTGTSGTTTLTGCNSYTGNTTVTGNMTLVVNSTTGSGTGNANVVNVNANGTLAGTGNIGSNVTVAGILSPGTAAAPEGLLTLSGGNLTLANGASLSFNVANATSSNATSTVNLTSGTLFLGTSQTYNVNLNLGADITNQTYDLITTSNAYSGSSPTWNLTVNNKPALTTQTVAMSSNNDILQLTEQTISTITWTTPSSITYGTALSSTQLDATGSVAGAMVYSPVSGTVLSAGAGQALQVTFTPADTTDYTTATDTVYIDVNQATPTITWATPVAITYGTTVAGSESGDTENWVVNGSTVCVAGTSDYSPTGTTVPSAGTTLLFLTFTPTDTTDYTTVTTSVSLTVNQATPTITWATPSAITYGTTVAGSESGDTESWVVNGSTVTVAGLSSYSPAGTTLPSAGTTSLSLMFTPADTTDYTMAATTVSLTVNQATPTTTWATPAAITYGTALSSTQLNATESVAGMMVYSPGAGTVLSAGVSQALPMTFTPTDTTDYTTATATVAITVNQAVPTITWATPAAITYGTALSATQLNATGSVAGAMVYSPVSGAVLSPGAGQALQGDLHAGGHDGLHDGDGHRVHQRQAGEHDHGVDLGVQSHSLRPERDVHGDGESAVQRHADGHGDVPGRWGGDGLGAGEWWASDVRDIQSGGRDGHDHGALQWGHELCHGHVGGVCQTVTQASTTTAVTASLSSPTTGQTVTFTASVTAVSGTFDNGGTVTFVDGGVAMGAAGVSGGQATYATFSLAAGTHTITALYGGDTNFGGSMSAGITETVQQGARVTPTITWATPSAITYGTALSATQLNATESVAGTSTYSPVPGAVLAAGTDTLSLTFTPTDTVDYTTATATVSITVNKAAPTITWAAPAAITYGTALSATQLNATWSVAGTMVYSPAAGTVLSAGVSQTLHMTLIPADTTDYTTATAMVYINVNQAGTTTAVVSSGNPSVFGQSVTFTATVRVTSPGAGTPTGTVTFKDGSSSIGTGVLTGGTTATFKTSRLTGGTHTITAAYVGDTNFSSSSGTLSGGQTIIVAGTTTTVSTPANPSAFGQNVTFTAVVSCQLSVVSGPSGTVTFLDGSTSLGTALLNSNEVATFATSSLAMGSHTITASYSGDTNFSPSSGTLSGGQTVTKAGTTTTVVSSANPSVFGQRVTFTAVVSCQLSVVSGPSGIVTFEDGGSPIGTATLIGGSATITDCTPSVARTPSRRSIAATATSRPAPAA